MLRSCHSRYTLTTQDSKVQLSQADDSEFASKGETDVYLYLVDHGFDDSIAKVFEGIFEILGCFVIL